MAIHDLRRVGPRHADDFSQSRTGERLTHHHLFRQTQFPSDFPNFIFEQTVQRFQQFQIHFRRQPAHIVVALDHRTGIAVDRDTFDHIRGNTRRIEGYGLFDR